MKKLILLTLCILLLTGCAVTYDGPTVDKPVLTAHTVFHYSFNGFHYANHTTFAYDIYGNRVRSMEYRDGELLQVTNMKYDDRGNIISKTVWDHSGWFPRFDRREKQTYDPQGRLLSDITYNFWGRQIYGSWYTYDDTAGTRTWTDSEGSTQTTWYDEMGRELRQIAGEYETIYVYDDRGNLVSWVSYHNGAPSDSYQARYDDRNRLIWGARYDSQGNLQSESEYIFDDEAHTMTFHRPDGQVRYEYYHPDGRPARIEDYNEAGDLSLVQEYTYRDIKIPAEGGNAP